MLYSFIWHIGRLPFACQATVVANLIYDTCKVVPLLYSCNKANAQGNGAQALSEVCAVCNDAHIEFKDGRYHAVGAPTEAALVVLVEKLGVADSGLKARIREQRSASPEGHADGTCQAYCRR